MSRTIVACNFKDTCYGKDSAACDICKHNKMFKDCYLYLNKFSEATENRIKYYIPEDGVELVIGKDKHEVLIKPKDVEISINVDDNSSITSVDEIVDEVCKRLCKAMIDE
ncbi:hypothetical protein D9O40_16795 [Clostridium autoethanogenum]|uniref:Uncharacterized protein n=1 Tax=Clostridium autoethanogenum TaxID=84023 RepID=A0A3M0S9F1_9CLOT|nr:hypothetical protein [Clostridium autoethanogenum]RMC95196.1 hypothetical protein D9O40_16795 [Clostridium autoethanogenum]